MKKIVILTSTLVSFIAATQSEGAPFKTISIYGEEAATLYYDLPGPEIELSGAWHKKQNSDATIVCHKRDYMYGEEDFRCYINGTKQPSI